MERAAKRGNAFAQYNLAAHLATGEEVQQDLQKALYWYRKAAAQRDPEAVYNLGIMYIEGEGVEPDIERGLKILEKAAGLGSADAQQLLGDVLVAGHYGTKRDPERAAHYYLRSLAGGFTRSALLLAVALERSGRISRSQLISALLRLAAEGGNPSAKEKLAAINKAASTARRPDRRHR